MRAATLVILIVCFVSIALADDFKTIDGKEYKNVKVSRVEPDGIVLVTKSGISKVSRTGKSFFTKIFFSSLGLVPLTAFSGDESNSGAAMTASMRRTGSWGCIRILLGTTRSLVRA
jgi:hypothetical protein